MSDLQPARFQPASALPGIGFKVASVVVFVAMSGMVKAAEGVPPGQVVFFRSFFSVFPILLFYAVRGELRTALETRKPVGHFLRAGLGAVAMLLVFFALGQLPLPEAIAIGYAAPLFIIILGAVVMHENVRLYRWSAVAIGLVGVAIITWPRLTLFSSDATFGAGEAAGALAALVAALFSAGAMLMIRQLVATERTATIVIYFSLASSLLALATVPFGWVWPTPWQWLLLVGVGLAGGIGQILLTEAYRRAEMSIIAPFEYSSLLIGIAVGYLFFAELPTPAMIVGGAIVVGSGVFIIWRERQLGLERARARSASTPQG